MSYQKCLWVYSSGRQKTKPKLCPCLDRWAIAPEVREYLIISPLWVEDIKQQKLPTFHTGRPSLTSCELTAEAVRKCITDKRENTMKHMETNRLHPPYPLSQYTHILTQEKTSYTLIYWNSHQESIPSIPTQASAFVFLPERDCVIGF